MIKMISAMALAVFLSAQASAHHTWAVDYDTTSVIEIRGIISSITWVNPHVRFQVMVDEGTNSEQTWNIAGTSVSNLARMNVTKDILSVGDEVRMAGWAARRSDHGMYMVNLLLPDGREAVFQGNAEPRWSEELVGNRDNPAADIDEANLSAPDSIFAVWVTGSRTLHPRATEDFPLSDRARVAIANYNPETDDPFGSCSPKGGSAVVDAPYPVALEDHGETIVFRLEEYDTVRTIHLTDIHDDRNVEPSLLGFSTGFWEGDTLLVTTTKIDYPFLHIGSVPDYIPQSQYARMQETFRFSAEETRMYYTLTVTDTEMLSEPLVMRKYFEWRPGETVQPYSCNEEGLFPTD